MVDCTIQVWEHEDFVIASMRQPLPADTVAASSTLRVYFDGGCRKGLGTSGATAFAPDRKSLRADACYHGEAVPTNNQVEAQGLLLALQLASELKPGAKGDGKHGALAPNEKNVLVLSNSSLTIAFM